MAKKKTKRKSGGSMMSMRSGFKSVAGTNRKRQPGGSEPISFLTVFGWLSAIAIAVALVWRFTR
jgi:hypothetical protein